MSNSENEDSQILLNTNYQMKFTSLNEIYNTYGYGSITLKAIACSTLAWMCNGLYLSLYSLMTIPISEEYKLNTLEKSMAFSLVFIGQAVGAFLYSLITVSRYYRREICLVFCSILVVCHLLTAIVIESNMFIITRFISGLCVGVITPPAYVIMMEYLPLRYRSFVSGVSLTFSHVSRLLLLLTMFAFMPNLGADNLKKTLLFTIYLPILTLIAIVFILNDSPRNLLLIGQEASAFRILSKMVGRKLTDYERRSIHNEVSEGCNKGMSGNLCDMFGKKYITVSICLMINFTIHGFAFFGTLLTSSMTKKELDQINSDDYREVLIRQIWILLTMIPPLIFFAYLTETSYLGRVKTYLISYIGAAVAMILCCGYPESFAVIYGIGASLMVAGNNISNTYASELYPTKIRNIALSFLLFVGRNMTGFSQVIFVWLFEVNILLPYYVAFMCLLVGVVSILLLPYETAHHDLDGDLSDSKI
jgi:MFS family permease